MPWTSSIYVLANIPNGNHITQNVNRQVIVVLVLLCYHLWFQIEFICPCTSQNFIHCYGYMVLPCLIISSIVVWNDKRIGRIFRYGCYHLSIKKRQCQGRFVFEFFIYVLQAATSGFLWCGSVLIDGNWYVCCGIGNNEESKTLSCMKEKDISLIEEARKVTLKNQSMVIGLTCILLTAACSFVLMLPWNRWCTRRNYFRAMFEEAVLEQTENILRNEMEKAAADSVTKSLISLSSATNTKTTSITEDSPEKVETTDDKEKPLLNINVNWEELACLADILIESIPRSIVETV